MAPLSPPEIAAKIVAEDPRFAVTEADVLGQRMKVFANTPTDLRAMLAASVNAHDDGDFVVQLDERWTYSEFCADVCRLSHALGDLGVGHGTRVALAMRNYPEMLIAMMAIISAGGVVVFVNAWWTEEELQYAFTDSGAKLAFADGPRFDRIAPFADDLAIRLIGVRDADTGNDGYRAMLDGAKNTDWPTTPIAPDDDFAVMYSSGSTGSPKGVVQTHRGAISAVYSWLLGDLVAAQVFDATGGKLGNNVKKETLMIITPLFHVTATHALWLQAVLQGLKVVLLPKWDAAAAVQTINRESVNIFVGVPTQAADLAAAAREAGVSMPTLEYIGTGGAKRPPAQVAEQANAFPGAVIATGWGMTETNALGLGFSGPAYLDQPGAAGRLIPPVQEMKIVDDGRAEVPIGQVGEIAVRSPANMRCYLNKPEETAEVLSDGWLYTGDLAKMDAEGVVTIVDRKKNIIIRGGENIACLDVEAAIHRNPAVLEAGVFQVPDARLGETVGAGVTLKPGHAMTAHDLRAFLAEHIAAYKIPEHIWFLPDALPRGATDKIDRRVLRADCLSRQAEDTQPEHSGGG